MSRARSPEPDYPAENTPGPWCPHHSLGETRLSKCTVGRFIINLLKLLMISASINTAANLVLTPHNFCHYSTLLYFLYVGNLKLCGVLHLCRRKEEQLDRDCIDSELDARRSWQRSRSLFPLRCSAKTSTLKSHSPRLLSSRKRQFETISHISRLLFTKN